MLSNGLRPLGGARPEGSDAGHVLRGVGVRERRAVAADARSSTGYGRLGSGSNSSPSKERRNIHAGEGRRPPVARRSQPPPPPLPPPPPPLLLVLRETTAWRVTTPPRGERLHDEGRRPPPTAPSRTARGLRGGGGGGDGGRRSTRSGTRSYRRREAPTARRAWRSQPRHAARRQGLRRPAARRLGAKHGKSPAQVLARWCTRRGSPRSPVHEALAHARERRDLRLRARSRGHDEARRAHDTREFAGLPAAYASARGARHARPRARPRRSARTRAVGTAHRRHRPHAAGRRGSPTCAQRAAAAVR